MFCICFELNWHDVLGNQAMVLRERLGLKTSNVVSFRHENSRVSVKITDPQKVRNLPAFQTTNFLTLSVRWDLLRKGDLVDLGTTDPARGPNYVGFVGFRQDLSEERALEILRDQETVMLNEKLEELRSKVLRAEKMAQECLENTARVRSGLTEKMEQQRQFHLARMESYSTRTKAQEEEISRLRGLVSLAAAEISNSRRFVRSKKLAELRERLEAALPAEQDDTNDN